MVQSRPVTADRPTIEPTAVPTAPRCQPSRASREAWTVRVALLILTLATLWTFAEVRHNDLVWDDRQNLVQNDLYRGLTLSHLEWMFTTSFGGHYQPLSWLSFAVEDYLWGGVSATGFHITNLTLHLATAIGFFFVARRLLATALFSKTTNGIVAGAFTASLLFAVHPLRVESVAWATERRDVLSGAWLMLCVLLYLRAHSDSGPARRPIPFALSVLCFALSLLSKASGVVLPAILLLLDVYPLRRFSKTTRAVTSASRWRILAEKLWFAVPAFGVALVALQAQSHAGALRTLSDHPLALRIGQAFHGIAFYLVKTIWPVGLIPLYEQRPDATGFELLNVLAAGFVITTTVVVWLLRRRHRVLLIAWAAYIIVLSPLLGLAQSGPQVAADRYSYLACMPWMIILGAVAARLWDSGLGRRTVRRIALTTVLAMVSVTLMALTRDQTRIWADSYTLWSTVIDRAPDTPTAHANLAVVLNQRREYARAKEHCLGALARLPGNRTAHRMLGRAALGLGELGTAEKHCRIALGIASDVGKVDTRTMFDLAVTLTKLGRFDEAEQTYRSMVSLEPDVSEWHFALAGLVASRGRRAEAVPILEEVLRLDPTRVEAYFRLGVLAGSLGEPARAISAWHKGLAIAPDDVHIRTQLAWTLATCRDDSLRNGDLALELARDVVRDSGNRNPRAYEALAAALADTGNYTAAAATVEELLKNESSEVGEPSRGRLQEQLDRYKAGKPVRE